MRALPGIPPGALAELQTLLERAERHGLAGVVHDALRSAGVAVDPAVEAHVARRAIARELDHAAHLGLLDTIDAALARFDLPAVVLKGPLFAERFYARPSARATSDVDILVREEDLDRALSALASVGYVAHVGPEEERFRREHHHLHLEHPAALALELHFHAYRGFGSIIPSEPLVVRRAVFVRRGYRALGVLAPEDELVYLAVHGAAHRFVRLGWLWDLKLLLDAMSPEELALAAERAREWGYARVMAFTSELLTGLLGVSSRKVAAFGSLDRLSRTLAFATVAEPPGRLARAATRFVFTTALCSTPAVALSHAASVVLSRARRAAR